MMQVAAYGRLGQDPKSIETRSGKAMAVTSMALDLLDKDGESHTQWLNVVTFGKVADLLYKQKKGDLVSVSGRVQINKWTNGDGQEQVQLSIIADTVISARSVRPGGRKKSLGSDSPAQEDAAFDDPLPF